MKARRLEERRQQRESGDPVPASLSRISRATRVVFSVSAILLRLFLLTPLHSFDTTVTNLGFSDFTDYPFSIQQQELLGLGLLYASPSGRPPDAAALTEGLYWYLRGIRLEELFRDTEDRGIPERFRVPNPAFDVSLLDASDGVQAYSEEVTTGVNSLLQELPTLPVPRDRWRFTRKSLQDLDEVIVIDTDKNMGFAAVDRWKYVEVCEQRLAATHVRVPGTSRSILILVRNQLEDLLREHGSCLPEWAYDFLRISAGMPKSGKPGYIDAAHHPRTGRPFSIPAYRALWKIHKAELDSRPITGNFCWILQCLSDVCDSLLLPLVRGCDDYIQDADDACAALSTLRVADTDYLVAYDWVNLYNTFNHAFLLMILRSFLEDVGMNAPLVGFLIAAVDLFLTQNYCQFDGSIWRQTLGFATGVSAGASLAHAFLNRMCRALFARFAGCIRFHKRYIDDGFMVWMGTLEQLQDWFSLMNQLADGMRITMDVSLSSVVFLDCRFFKGQQWLRTGSLDVQLFCKPQNRFLYKPFCSVAPRSQFLGVIHSELRRYIKRDSDVFDYRNDAADLFDRLRARGYPPRFLRRAFDQAPSWLSRHELLSARSDSNGDSRIHTFKLVYSRELAQLGLGDLLHRHEHLLPSYIAKKMVVCWRAAPKLGRALIPYRYGEAPEASTDPSTASPSAVSLGTDD